MIMTKVLMDVIHKTAITGLLVFTVVAATDVTLGFNHLVQRSKALTREHEKKEAQKQLNKTILDTTTDALESK